MGYNPILSFLYFLKLLQFWPVGTPSCWLLCSFKTTLFWHHQMFQALVFSLSQSCNQPLLAVLVSFTDQDLGTRYDHSYRGVTTSVSSQETELGNICTKHSSPPIHIYLYFCIPLSVCLSIYILKTMSLY